MENNKTKKKHVIILCALLLIGAMLIGVILFAVLMKHEHKYIPNITAPTCTEQGYTTYICDCGESYTGDYVNAHGHT
ncbi:MAG: hypothetical protein IKD07_05590, partial [Clostridia bacterium]|nr:hypothetical protein [Clostridia bacterium]